MLKEAFADMGYQVLEAEDGKKAWQLIKRNLPSLVVTDWVMPEMDGLELCRKIRSISSEAYIYTIMLTGKNCKEDLLDVFGAGADDYITKPIDIGELQARVKTGLRVINLINTLYRTTEELKNSNAELEQFAYVASHDLQEPLRKVGSYMELVAERYQDQLDQDAREFIEYAVDGARRMKIMIDDLLVYSRVGTRGNPFVSTDMMKVMQDVLNDLELNIQDNDAVVTYDTLPVVTADNVQLQQLFRNLIGNAIKYRGQAPPQIHVSVQRQKRAWRFCVQDNGIGIDPRFLERIFQIFQRLHGPGQYDGTGIGLAVCKKIVERHSGSIKAESAPGTGSKFYFTIPDRGEKKDHG